MTPQLPGAKTGLNIAWLFFSIFAAVLITLALFALLRAGLFYSLYTWLLAHVVESTGLDLWSSRALTLGLLALAWFFPWPLLLLPWIKNAKWQVAVWIAITLLVLVGMEFFTRDVYFSRADGRPEKYYIQTLEGFKFSTTPGTDPVYGIPYRPVTQEVAAQYLHWKASGGNMRYVLFPREQYFNPATGEPLSWYAKTPDGTIEVFTLPGFHPKYGTKLLPVTADIVAAYETQEMDSERQRQEAFTKQQLKEKEETERKAKADAARNAREEADRQAREEELLKQPLQPGRYLFENSRPTGTLDGLTFALSEVDLRQDAMLIHLEVECVPVDSTKEKPWGERRHIRLKLVRQDGSAVAYTGIHVTEGALTEGQGSITFPSVGRRGAFVMEFPRQENLPTTFSLTINDQPLCSGINLHKGRYQSF